MVYRFSAIIHTEGKRAFVEIPFNVWEPEDTLQLVLEAETEEERSFYELVGDFLLQVKQKKVVEENLF